MDIEGVARVLENSKDRSVAGVILPAVHQRGLQPELGLLQVLKRELCEVRLPDAGHPRDNDGVGSFATSEWSESLGKRCVFVVSVLQLPWDELGAKDASVLQHRLELSMGRRCLNWTWGMSRSPDVQRGTGQSTRLTSALRVARVNCAGKYLGTIEDIGKEYTRHLFD